MSPSELPAPIRIGRAPVHPITFPAAVRAVLDRATVGAEPGYVVTPNAHHVVLLRDSPELRDAYAGAWLSVADGMPLVWASHLLGTPVPEKVSGSDLLPAICKAAAGIGTRVFFLGGRPGAAARAAEVLTERYPGLQVVGTDCPPLGFERDAGETERVHDAIRAAAPGVLFVGLGAPKQELWMRANCSRLGVPVSIGIGGSFDFVAGYTRRAPRWMRRNGLEWLHRVASEPRRLGRRYAVTNPQFVAIVLGQALRRGSANGGG